MLPSDNSINSRPRHASSSRATSISGSFIRHENRSARTASTPTPLYISNQYDTTASRTRTRTRGSTGRPATRTSTARPRTALSTLGIENQEIVCAVSESRGISPTVGLAFVNLDTGEAVLCQISDSQTYVRTIHKLLVFSPSNILIVSTAATPKSKLFSIVEDNLEDIGSNITLVDRKYYAETTGVEYINNLAFADDLESIKTAISGNYYAVCCFAAALKYIECGMLKTFNARSLRIKYEPSEGSMMIDLSTVRSLELVQNLQNSRSKDCLLGLLNNTQTPMGLRLLSSNVLQPLTDADTINTRLNAVEELSTKEEMFFGVRKALKPFLDADKTLTQLIIIPVDQTLYQAEQAINNVIMLKYFVGLVKPVFEALSGARATMLDHIRSLCTTRNLVPIQELIDSVINEDTTYAKAPLDLRNQRTYAVRSGANGLLDVARLTYKEAMTDAIEHITDIAGQYGLALQTKFDSSRYFYIRVAVSELEHRSLPGTFINAFRKKDNIECTTLMLMKLNQKITDSHTEVIMMSDRAIQELILSLREHVSVMFKISESIAMLDMLSSFAQLVTIGDYCRPCFDDTLAIQQGRHPIKEKIQTTKFIPNDVYASQQTRFQIITGCNMSGKSTYIRSVALMTVMAQIGSFVPANYASFPVVRQLFARVSLDDNIEANVSTFAAEMRETAFILRNIDRHSLVIIDELGRGTSTRDGLAIAIAIAEALVQSRALIWFATHFRDLASIMTERNGVVNLHLAVSNADAEKMEMLYRLDKGAVREEHYGLKLAKVIPLPADVIEHAELVASTLEQQSKKRKQNSPGVIQARRRKLILNLKEHLVQAKDGHMTEAKLKEWLIDLQNEFVIRMTALDEEAAAGLNEINDSLGPATSDQVSHSQHERRSGSSRVPRKTSEQDSLLLEELAGATYQDDQGVETSSRVDVYSTTERSMSRTADGSDFTD